MSWLSTFRRHQVEPLWARWTGTPLLREWQELEQSQHLPAAALRERQWQRLSELIDFVWRENPYHRRRFEQAGFTPPSLRSLADLARLPILSKADLRAAPTALLSRGFEPSRLMTFRTGGSTGKSLTLYAAEEVSERRNACARRSNRWTGWEVGEPVAAVWGNPKRPETLRAKLREWLLSPVIYLDTMSVTHDAVVRFASEWRRVRPTLLFGHAHSIFLLAQLVREGWIAGITPRGILATSMMLIPRERRVIEDVFGVPVFDRYGCEEVGLIAAECEQHQGMHVNIDHLVVEILRDDGTPAAPGELGHVVVTDLLNRAMPLIRYRVEDMAEPLDRPCACGRGLPLLQKVAGRVADFLVRRDGSRVAGISLIENSLTRVPGIAQLQIVQDELLRFRLRIVTDAGFSTEHRRTLVAYFQETFPGAAVDVEDVPEIRPEPNGKYRFSICKIGG